MRSSQIIWPIAETSSGVPRMTKSSTMNGPVHKPLRRASAMPAGTPRQTAITELMAAACNDTINALTTRGWLMASQYQRVENSVHT